MAVEVARDQDVPEIYLNENGKFGQGMSSVYRYDLVNSALGIKSPDAKMTFPRQEALKRLKQRNWMKFYWAKRAVLERENPELAAQRYLEQALWNMSFLGFSDKKILKRVKRVLKDFAAGMDLNGRIG
jgi:hypothetical protein